MAQAGRMTTGTSPRLLQLGIDKIIQHFDNQYIGEVDKIFTKVKATKGFYEIVQLAGMGIAGRKGEGDTLTYDSINQDFNPRYTIYTYEKSARITMEAQEDNLYEDMLERIGKELVKAHKYNKDYQGANILNNATTTTWGDGVALLSTAHPLQAGGTNTNRLSPDLDLSEDACEAAVILVDNFLNPDGMNSEYRSKNLIIPVALKYIAERICSSKYRTSTTDNDINAVMNRGDIESYIMWKRLTSATTWYLSTDAPDGLLLADKKGITTKAFEDNFTYDQVVTSHTRFRTLVGDHRCLVGSVGP